MKEASKRTSIITWFAPFIVLIGGAVLAALAQGASEPPDTRSNPTLSIDTRELAEKAIGPLPLQFYDAI